VPGDVSDFKPAWRKAAPFYQDACTATEIKQYLDSCLGNGDHTLCATIADKCVQCIATPDTADRYGPVIIHAGWAELNLPGCLANAMNDPGGILCAASVQAVRSCELVACGANCPVTSEATLKSYQDCTQLVDTGECQGFISDAACVASLQDDAGPLVAQCLAGATFADRYTDIAKLFCLAAPATDAGTGPD
jgi:hypothetical protein